MFRSKRIRHGKKGLFFVCLFIFTLLAFTVSPTNEVASMPYEFEEKRVLFISSYSSSFNTFYRQIDGINETFEGYPITVDMEFMDSKRFYTTPNFDNFYESLSYKMSLIEYDLVMVSDDNGLIFVMDHQEELFNEIPIVFFGINNVANAQQYSEDPYVTGIVEGGSMYETLEIASQLNPNASKFIALVDDTPSGQFDLNFYYEQEDLFPNHEFDKLDMSEVSMDEFLVDLASVDDDSIIILLAALRDVNGDIYDFDESLQLITETTDLPVFHIYEHGIGDGVVGGKVISHYILGIEASKIVLEIFNGTDVSDIALVEECPNVYMFDYRLMQTFNYNEGELPLDTIFVNKDLSFFEQYTLYIYMFITFMIVITITIIFLIWALVNRNRARDLAVETNKSLENANFELEVVNNKLKYSSYHDYLTGLYNRNYFEEEYKKCDQKENYPLSIVLADVNGLKLINDAFGHMLGDKALVKTARLLQKVFPNDLIARIGGDEFAIVIKNKTQEEVYKKISEARLMSMDNQIEGVTLSLSLGFAIKEDDTVDLNEMFTEAEDWMYREKLNQVPSNRSATIDTIIATINQKDEYSEFHSKRVSEIAGKIAELSNHDAQTIGQIKTAGLLHDIGKIIVPSEILNKKGKLTESEYNELKKHSEIGYRILNSVSSMRDISEFVFCHHERIDGLGYPRGLKKDEIPMESRIISVADALDAMLTDRLYRSKLSKEACMKELEKHKGTQFCTKIVDVVIENFDDIYQLINEQL